MNHQESVFVADLCPPNTNCESATLFMSAPLTVLQLKALSVAYFDQIRFFF